jgi:hypothetical protein
VLPRVRPSKYMSIIGYLLYSKDMWYNDVNGVHYSPNIMCAHSCTPLKGKYAIGLFPYCFGD